MVRKCRECGREFDVPENWDEDICKPCFRDGEIDDDPDSLDSNDGVDEYGDSF